MSSTQRAGLLSTGLIVAIVAFIALKPGKENAQEPAKAQQTTQKATPKTTEKKQTSQTGGTSASNAEKASPTVPVLRSGKEQTIEVKKGEMVHFKATSDVPEKVHVHGYDIPKDIPAGKTIDVKFKATMTGVYEIELEKSGEKLATLKVNP